MTWNKFYKPTKKKITALFLVSGTFILSSYLVYHFTSVGYTNCGSACSDWLSSIFPSAVCFDVCVPQNIPHSIHAPLLQIGALLLISSVIYSFIYYFKFRKGGMID